jgi:hypothetical protein
MEERMRRFHVLATASALTLTVWAAGLVVGRGSEAGAASTCTAATLRGPYAFTGNGFAAGAPYAFAGQVVFDGNGNVSGVSTDVFNGTVDNVAIRGTYSVDPDCRGAISVTTKHEARVDGHRVDFWITQGGQRVLFVLTDTWLQPAPNEPQSDDLTIVLNGFAERM